MSLWPLVLAAEQRGDESGSRIAFNSVAEEVMDSSVPFIIQIAEGKWPNDGAKKDTSDPFVPPYDPDLYICDIGTDHVLLLNKFHVAKHHMLSVTRDFYAQKDWLRATDFAAVWRVLCDFKPSLAFFNSGKVSGASQQHSHFQIVGLPLSDVSKTECPLEQALHSLPFHHAMCELSIESHDVAGNVLEGAYRRLMAQIDPDQPAVGPSFAYNIVLRPKWLLIIPRSKPKFGHVSVNGLGYTGSFLVRSKEARNALVEAGCMQALVDVSL